MSTIKIRITADTEQDAELLIAALTALLPGYSSRKARAGNNPKYADNQKFLAYGELTIERRELELLIEKPTKPVSAAVTPRKKAKQ